MSRVPGPAMGRWHGRVWLPAATLAAVIVLAAVPATNGAGSRAAA